MKSGEVTIVFPFDFRNRGDSEVDHIRMICRVLSKYYKVKILHFPDKNGISASLIQRLLPLEVFLLVRSLLGHRCLLIRYLFRAEGTIYVSRMPSVLATIVVRAVLARRLKVVMYLGGVADTSTRIMFKLYKLLAPVVLKSCDGVVCVSSKLPLEFATRYARCYLSIPGIVVDSKQYEMSSDKRAEVRRSLGLVDEFAIGVIGPFWEYNRPSITYVRENIHLFPSNTAFVFVGDVDLRDVFYHPKVVFLGRVGELNTVLGALDCVLIPRFFSTGAPMGKMVYAMAAGLPVITNNPEGMEIADGREAIIAELPDFPHKIAELMQNKALTREIGDNARAYVQRQHNERLVIERLPDFISRIAGNPGFEFVERC